MKTIRYAVLTLLAGGLAMAQATEPIPPAADTPPVPTESQPVPAAEPSPPVAADCPPEGVPPAPEALPLPVDPGYTTQPQYKAPKHVKSRIGMAANLVNSFSAIVSECSAATFMCRPRVRVSPVPKKKTPSRARFIRATRSAACSATTR